MVLFICFNYFNKYTCTHTHKKTSEKVNTFYLSGTPGQWKYKNKKRHGQLWPPGRLIGRTNLADYINLRDTYSFSSPWLLTKKPTHRSHRPQTRVASFIWGWQRGYHRVHRDVLLPHPGWLTTPLPPPLLSKKMDTKGPHMCSWLRRRKYGGSQEAPLSEITWKRRRKSQRRPKLPFQGSDSASSVWPVKVEPTTPIRMSSETLGKGALQT